MGAHIKNVFHINNIVMTKHVLSMSKKHLNKPLFMMNADILTKVNFTQLLDFHLNF